MILDATAEAVNDYYPYEGDSLEVQAGYWAEFAKAAHEAAGMTDLEDLLESQTDAQEKVGVAYWGTPSSPDDPPEVTSWTGPDGQTCTLTVPGGQYGILADDLTLARARGRRDALELARDTWFCGLDSEIDEDDILGSLQRWAQDVAAGERLARPKVTLDVVCVPNHVRVVSEPAPEPRDDPPPAPRDDPDPGTLPVELLRCPGFISETMDYTLATAPYPNQALAFCGALALQSLLAARKVQVGGLRSNVYIVALAFSGAGKDSPRATNLAIAKQAGFLGLVRGKFASGQGIEDALEVCPALLFQVDEVDGLFRAIKDERDPAANSIVGTLLELVGAAQTGLCRRAKAGETQPVFINQPSLTLYGTCIPTNYYESLCERVARNGLLARMIVVESPDRGEWQEVSPTPIPPRVLEAADYWKKLTGDGNLWDQHPTPSELPFTEAARRLRAESNRNLDRRWDEAKQAGDAVRTTVLARVGAIGTTLAMLYAVSENHADPKITEQAVTWGYEISTRQADRMLHQFGMHAFSNEFEQLLKRILRKLSEAPKKTLPHSKLLKASRVDARTLENVIKTLILRQEIALVQETTKGRSAAAYKLL